MAQHSATLLDQAMELPTNERAKLARELLRSLDGTRDDNAESAWAAELERRVGASNDASATDWSTVRDEARERLRRR
jgi:putative addiction module component (TIGR02574 family)